MPTASSRDARNAADEAVNELQDTRGASRGTEQKGPQSGQRPEEAREGVDAAAAATFARELAELAAADPSEGGQQAAGERDREEALDDDVEVEVEDDFEEARPARKETVEPGGEDDPEPAAEPPPPVDPADATADAPPGSPIPKLRPAARVAWLGVEEPLAAAAEAAILFGYPQRASVARILTLTTTQWMALVRAMRTAREPVLQGFVLKALAANRDPVALPSFAARLAELGGEEAVTRQHAHGPVPPRGADCEARDLRLHHDPIEAMDPSRDVHEAAPADPWTVPMWLRGVPRGPLELAIVGVDQALTDDLRTGEHTADGATDALTAALAPHGEEHPSLKRWFLNLAARADSHGGLVRMRDAMLRARAEKAR